MKALDIKVERTGFPVTLAGIELWFDCTAEHIEEYQKNIDQVTEKLNAMTDDESLENKKTALAYGYDVIFGDGTFKKLYAETPDIIAWMNAFFAVTKGIFENVQSFYEEQEKISKDAQKEFLMKKAKKKG